MLVKKYINIIGKHLSILLMVMMILSDHTYSQSITWLGTLGGSTSVAYDVSSDGIVVVGSAALNDGSSGMRAFRWTDSTGIQNLDPIGAGNSYAYGVSENGSVVVGDASLSGFTRAFRWTDSTGMLDLGHLGGSTSASRGVSADGAVIVGYAQNASFQYRAFRWQNGNMLNLGTLGGNLSSGSGVSGDGYVIVGTARNSSSQDRAFRIIDSTLIMEDLGTLGGISSVALSTGADGSVIVGYSTNSSGQTRAFRWTSLGGMQDLGTLGGDWSQAYRVSDDGDVVVGLSPNSNSQIRAFIWKDGIMQDLNEIFSGLLSVGSTLERASAISPDGRYIVGRGYNAATGRTEAFLLDTRPLVYSPSYKKKWMAGETNTIKWIDQGWSAVHIKCILNYETALESEIVIAQNYAGTPSEYQWNIPDTILSYKSLIIIEDVSDPLNNIQSNIFRIKPYIITKVIQDSIYQPYRFNLDRFSFLNTSNHIWPEWHTDQFDYQGTDPNTGLQYSQTVFDSIFAKTGSDSVPDWPAFVRVFGLNATYRDLESGTYNLKALTKWSKDSYTFSGVCFGFAIANANYFNNREAFLNNFPDFPDTIAVTLTSANVDSNIIKTIVELYEHQRGNPHRAYDLVKRSRLPNETIADLREMFSADNSQLRPLIFRNNNGNGGHAVLPFALEKDDSNWVIRIYDNNYSSIKNVTVYPDSANGDGKWINPDYSSWGGEEKLFLKNLAAEYLVVTPTFPKTSNTNSPFSLSDSLIIISTAFNSDIIVQDDYDNITGYVNGVTYENIPNSFADVIDTGYEIPPIGFILPSDTYKIDLSNYTTDLPKIYLEKGDISFIYERSDAQSSQTDFLKFDGSLSVINPESVSKKTKVITLDSNNEEDKMFVISNLNILQTDSINISLSVDQLHLVNYGVDKTYDVGLEYAALGRSEIFSYHSILLTANTKHLLSPDWNDIQNNDLIIYVDIGNNGMIDDTLTLTNQITGLEDQSSLLSPNSFNLAQNYPNPFNPSTTIKFSLPENSMVTIKVYNIVGEEVATLLSEERDRGVHSVNFNVSSAAGGLSSGVYFYKIQAGSYTSTKKMLLMK